MYSVSNDFKTAIKKSIISYDLKGTLDGEPFSRQQVLSCMITNQSCSDEEIQIGSTYVGELQILLRVDVDRYTVLDKVITLECGVKLADDSFEYVPMGVFNVVEAERTQQGLKLKAFDNMTFMDKETNSEQVTGTPYQIATWAVTQCNLSLANADFDSFANYDKTLFLYPENDCETDRDILYWIAQTVGCFVTADRNGDIEFRQYGSAVIDTLGTDKRYSGGKVADFMTSYERLSCYNIEEGTTSVYQASLDEGLTYALGKNPFLQYGNYDEMRENVLAVVNSWYYCPFTISLPANPSYDLGDILSFPGGLGDSSKKFCVTKFVWKYNESNTLTGAGKNPRLKIKSRLEKELDGQGKTSSDKYVIQYYSFTNVADINIGDGETETIIDIIYSAVKKTVAIFLAEVLATIETTVSGINYYDGEAEFLFYLDSVLVSRIPKETWRDGEHIKHLMNYLVTEAGVLHTLEVKCKMTGGSALIKMGAIKACLYGQNLVASDDFTGIIKVNQKPTLITLEEMDIHSVNDSQTLTTLVPHTESLSETISAFSLVEMSVLGAIDTVTTTLDHSSKAIITETGDKLLTETGDVLYTEGD